MSLSEVRPSAIHGRGVFAKRDIRVGETVCVYDGFSVPDNGEFGSYRIKTRRGVKDGFREPRTRTGIAQFINDACMFTLEKNTSVKDMLFRAVDYEKQSTLYSNVSFENTRSGGIKAVATKPIRKGEEIFVPYMPYYWFGFNVQQHSDDLEFCARVDQAKNIYSTYHDRMEEQVPDVELPAGVTLKEACAFFLDVLKMYFCMIEKISDGAVIPFATEKERIASLYAILPREEVDTMMEMLHK